LYGKDECIANYLRGMNIIKHTFTPMEGVFDNSNWPLGREFDLKME